MCAWTTSISSNTGLKFEFATHLVWRWWWDFWEYYDAVVIQTDLLVKFADVFGTDVCLGEAG